MEYLRTNRFKKAYRRLSSRDQARVEKALRQFDEDRKHPSLHLEKITGSVWSIRASDSIRITLEFDKNATVLRNVDTQHTIYGNP